MTTVFTAASLFSGVGGLDLAATQAGFRVTDMYEWDAYCCRVLRARFPGTRVHEGDIDDVQSIPAVDLVYGGPPCQPHSLAGDRAGADDPRHKWPAMYRLVNQARPRCVVVENVRGGVSSGLLDEVASDLEGAGYQVIPLLYPVVLFDAPHERYRLFIVAYRQGAGLQARGQSAARLQPQSRPREGGVLGDTASDCEPHVPQSTRDSRRAGQPVRAVGYQQRKLPQPGMGRTVRGAAHWLDFPGFPGYQNWPQFDYEPSRTVIRPGKHHQDRIKALGNIVVPQQSLPIFRALYQWMESLS